MAANSLFTLSDIAVQVSQNYGDTSDITIAKAKQWINRALIRVGEIADWSWLHVYDEVLNTVSGTETYSLIPAASGVVVKKVQAVWVQDTARRKLRKMEDRIFRAVFTQNVVPQGKPLYYREYGRDALGNRMIALYPIPNGIMTIKYDYVKEMPLLVNNTDDVRVVCGMPEYMVDALIELATAISFREQDDGDYMNAMSEAVARWQALAAEDLSEIDDQIRAAPFGESLDYQDPVLPPQYGDVF